MPHGLFGAGTVTHSLRAGLDQAAAAHRAIAERLAQGMSRSTAGEFAEQLDRSVAATEQDLTRDMTALADVQLRFEAAARLLQRSYADLRTAIRDRG